MGRREDERIDASGCYEHIHNENKKLPGSEERIKAHCKRVKKEEKAEKKKRKKKK